MGSSSFNQQSNHGTMDDQGLLEYSISSSSEVSSLGSDSESMEEVASSASELSSSSSSPTSPSSGSASSSGQLSGSGALGDMSSLLQQLPFKCLEDLAKPENPYKKKLKSCKSYGGLLSSTESHRSNHLSKSSTSSRLICKKPSRGSCSSLGGKRVGNGCFPGNRPPIAPPPPHRSTTTSSFSNQTPLFA
ncbi:unnamed protein product [Ilex paraguariensis]|uniref:Uncharacterized protein n=1 Tax=Ilex paraguariensis TaxID=185542 RepID=A0ABC8TP35_9AQUA